MIDLKWFNFSQKSPYSYSGHVHCVFVLLLCQLTELIRLAWSCLASKQIENAHNWLLRVFCNYFEKCFASKIQLFFTRTSIEKLQPESWVPHVVLHIFILSRITRNALIYERIFLAVSSGVPPKHRPDKTPSVELMLFFFEGFCWFIKVSKGFRGLLTVFEGYWRFSRVNDGFRGLEFRRTGFGCLGSVFSGR